MAGASPFPSTTTCMILLFFFTLLLASHHHFVMAVPKHTFFISSSTSATEDGIGGTKKRNTMEAAPSSKEVTIQNAKMDHMTTTKEINNNVPDLVILGPKGESSRAPRQWQDRVFNASEHEVPSGPNPISN